jgi:DNA-directed RNA polymerase subunit H
LSAEETKKVDILKHVLMPKCTILSENEKQLILKKYNISALQLPVLSVKDPLAKAIDAKEGEVVKVTRIGPPAGTSYYFRRVVG